MQIILLIFALFVLIYLAFNAYGLTRILAIRMKGDATLPVVTLYVAIIIVLVLVFGFLILTANWENNLKELVNRWR